MRARGNKTRIFNSLLRRVIKGCECFVPHVEWPIKKKKKVDKELECPCHRYTWKQNGYYEKVWACSTFLDCVKSSADTPLKHSLVQCIIIIILVGVEDEARWGLRHARMDFISVSPLMQGSGSAA